MSTLMDRALDALDSLSEPNIFRGLLGITGWQIPGDARKFHSVQDISDRLGCSDSTSRKAIHRLINDGLAEGYYVIQTNGIRRLIVTGEAV